jgi:hypothetical protein
MSTETEEMPEVTDERIYEDLKAYAAAGMLDYVLPTEPLGEQWIVGWHGQILKFVTKEGVVGFLTGIQVGSLFAAALHSPNLTESLPAMARLRRAAGADEGQQQ